MIARRVVRVFRSQGAGGVIRAALRRLRYPRVRCFALARRLIEGAFGLEVGGPSSIFSRGGLIPVYSLATRIDNCNFSLQTIFGNSPVKSSTSPQSRPVSQVPAFEAGKYPGQQFVAEGSDLGGIAAGRYDFVLSSHMLEHSANPLRALREWRRVLKPLGGLILVLPHHDGTFDHRRPVTSIEHLVQDYQVNVGEDDMTHVAEVLELHDLSRDEGAGDMAAMRERTLRNFENRGVHHHVFDTRLAARVVAWAGFDLLTVELLLPYHIVLIARKSASQANEPPESVLAQVLTNSPFPTDRSC